MHTWYLNCLLLSKFPFLPISILEIYVTNINYGHIVKYRNVYIIQPFHALYYKITIRPWNIQNKQNEIEME